MEMFKRGVVVTGHDRYAVYRMIGKRVAFANPKRRTHVVEGRLDDVSRDIFEDELDLTVDSKVYSFKEPSAIFRYEAGVVLVYGDVKPERGTDEELFKMAAEKGFRENVHEVLKRTAPKGRRDVHIYVIPEEPKVRRRRRRK